MIGRVSASAIRFSNIARRPQMGRDRVGPLAAYTLIPFHLELEKVRAMSFEVVETNGSRHA